MLHRFWLIRHALVEASSLTYLYGTADVPICESTMEAQAPRYAALAARLPAHAELRHGRPADIHVVHKDASAAVRRADDEAALTDGRKHGIGIAPLEIRRALIGGPEGLGRIVVAAGIGGVCAEAGAEAEACGDQRRDGCRMSHGDSLCYSLMNSRQ